MERTILPITAVSSLWILVGGCGLGLVGGCGSSHSSPDHPFTGTNMMGAKSDPSMIAPNQDAGPGRYPSARRSDITDNFHGTQVADPYRWLEDPDSKETKQWIALENKLTATYLDSIPEREAIRQRLTGLWNYERYGIPSRVGGKYFFSKNNGLQNQSVFYMARKLSDKPTVVFDPNTWSADGTVSLGGMSISDDARYIAYGVQTAGLDWAEWRVRDLKTGKDTADKLRWIKFSRVSWTKDNKGFYYTRYPAPSKGAEKTAGNFFAKVYYHRLGTEQANDSLIYEDKEHPKYGFNATVTEDNQYLVMSTWKGTGETNLVQVLDLKRHRPTKPGDANGLYIPIATEWIGEFIHLGNDGTIFYFKTNYQAPRGRIIAVDLRKPQKEHWKELVAESKDTISSASIVGNTLFLKYLHDATTLVSQFDLRGRKLKDVALPGLGTAEGFSGRRKNRETFYVYTSFTEPSSIYRDDLKSGKSSLFRKPHLEFGASNLETRQVFYRSKDGTRVPMFIVAPKGLKLDGSHPTLLYGYGGFNISLTPSFKISRAVWLEMGGVFALANIRGGGEYGEAWHKAGTKLNKQNVFDDFIAAAEYLIAEGYTQPAKLAIEGRSNGGLLIGAVSSQRPDLFGAALPGVGVMDMLRFHKFTIGWAWVDDYGSAENAEEFAALRAYSPYHNLKVGTRYPTTMVTTADHDDRVVPGHSFKYAAALQHAHRGDNPVLIRIETQAGHGGGTPTAKLIDQATDTLAFLVKALNMKPSL